MDDAGQERHLGPGELAVERDDRRLRRVALFDRCDRLVAVGRVRGEALIRRAVGLPLRVDGRPVHVGAVVPVRFIGEGEGDLGVAVDRLDVPRVEIGVVLVRGAVGLLQEDLRHVPRSDACSVRGSVAVERVQLLRDLVDREADLAADLQVLTGLGVVIRRVGLDGIVAVVTVVAGVGRTARKGKCEGSAERERPHQLVLLHGAPFAFRRVIRRE